MLLKRNKNKGFTLIEVLLSIAIIALIAGIGGPVYQSFQVRNDLDIATNSIAQSLRRAQILSQLGDSDASWGVSVQVEYITLFQGTGYSARVPAFDEVFYIPSTITPSGLSEIIFLTLTGNPKTAGTITLTSNISETRIIQINEKGNVEY